MKILLISSSSDLYRLEYTISYYSSYAVGLLYLDSALRNAGHDVKMMLHSPYPVEKSETLILEEYERLKPDVVAFSVLTINRDSTFRLIEKFNAMKTPPKIIMGGIHTTISYDSIIQKYKSPITVIGEGEITTVKLVNALEHNLPLKEVKGIAFYENNKVVKTEERPLITNLDTIKFPNHEHVFDLDPSRITISILSSRGCPSRCSFCCLQTTTKHIVRKRSPENVIEEIKYLVNKYPRITTVLFVDDALLLDNERVIKLCKLIIKEKLDYLKYGCETRVKPVSRKMFYWMRKAGFMGIMFGLETGSPCMLESIHKEISQQDVLDLITIIKPFNFRVFFFMMCGFPGENFNTIKESAQFLEKVRKIQYYEVNFVASLKVFPGTEVYEIMKNYGDISNNYWFGTNDVPMFTSEHPKEIIDKYENYLLDRISIANILSVGGFCRQFMKSPMPIIAYILRHKETIILPIDTMLRKYFLHYYFLTYRRLTRRRTNIKKIIDETVPTMVT